MRYQNPIIRGFHPDPSACRVGNDYYLVTSTFEYYPGIELWHSRDLVRWEQIGNVLTSENGLDLSKVKEEGGVWAPTIRYREENRTFYIAVTIEKQGNLVIHARDPRGPWTGAVWIPSKGIDPSLLFDDGKCWFCVNDWEGRQKPGIVAAGIDPDTGRILQPFRFLWSGTGGGWIEAPHLYHIGEWYYLLTAEGGTGWGHMETAARSRSLFGPYESCPWNPFLTNRNDTSKQLTCTGHGDLVEDTDGNWWMVHLAVRPGVLPLSQLGRETCLTPVRWKEGWPCVRDGRARIEEDGSAWFEGSRKAPGSEKSSGSAAENSGPGAEKGGSAIGGSVGKAAAAETNDPAQAAGNRKVLAEDSGLNASRENGENQKDREISGLDESTENAGSQKCRILHTDDFSSESWPPFWHFVRNPDLTWYERGNGTLGISPAPDADEDRAEAMVLTPQPDFAFTMAADAETPGQTGVEAGVIVWNTHPFWCFFGIRRSGDGSDGTVSLFLRRRVDDILVEKELAEFSGKPGDRFTLSVRGTRDGYTFACGEKEITVPAGMFCGSVLPRAFTGTMVGLRAGAAESGRKGQVRFHGFRLMA